MKILKIALFVLACLLILCVTFYAHYDGFDKLNVRIAEQGGETVVYDEFVGDYIQSGVAMNMVYYLLKNDYKIKTVKGFGLYLDNPKNVERGKQRSEVGCIIESADIEKFSTLKSKFKIKVLPRKQYITTEFPFKGKVSIIFSLMKVYPALHKFAEKNKLNGGAVMEIYDMPNKMIFYRQEIINKDTTKSLN